MELILHLVKIRLVFPEQCMGFRLLKLLCLLFHVKDVLTVCILCINYSWSPLTPVTGEDRTDCPSFTTGHLVTQLDAFPGFWKSGEWSRLKTLFSAMTILFVL